MKDLIIKDMEMPINCVKCKIWSLCWNEDPYWFERREDCPLREITEDFDTISRGAAIEAVKEALNPSISHFVKAKIAIENLPPSPSRPHGHWIQISPAGIYECSECGKNVKTNDIEAYEFCHGCGADMQGGTEQ